MPITYQRDIALDPVQVARVYDAAGLIRPTNDLARIERMLAHANLVISAWNDDILIGVSRALTDFGWCCYLSDLAVDRAYQKLGVGTALIQQTREAAGTEVSLILLAAPGAMSYYSVKGFDKIENGFVIKRQR